MDNQQAKFVLQSWRANGADVDDAHFNDALRQAEHDPALAEWFAREQELDRVIATKLRQCPVPPDLCESILAGHAEATPVRTPRRRSLLALAASIVLLAAAVSVMVWRTNHPSGEFEAFRHAMVGHLNVRFSLIHQDTDMGRLQHWVSGQSGLAGTTLPAGLAGLSGLGCRTWKWGGKPVGLICFRNRDGKVAHLMVVPGKAVQHAPSGAAAEFHSEAGWNTASWREGDLIYLMATQSDRAALENLLHPKV